MICTDEVITAGTVYFKKVFYLFHSTNLFPLYVQSNNNKNNCIVIEVVMIEFSNGLLY